MTIPGKEKEIKRYRRARFWDYKRGASLFITIALERSPGAATRSGTANRSGTARPSSLSKESEGGCAVRGFAPGSEDGCAVRGFAHRSEDGCAVRGFAHRSEDGCAARGFAHRSEDGCAARNLFGKIVDGKMVLSALGRVVAEALDSITRYNPGVVVFGRVVMPDHVHFNVNLAPGLAEPLKTLGKAITRFKNFTIKQSKLLARSSNGSFHGFQPRNDPLKCFC